jgi:hypothetical protein
MDVTQGTPPPYITPLIALVDLGTDSRAAVQLSCDRSETGPLQGQTILTDQGLPIVKAQEFSLVLLSGIVFNTLLDHSDQLPSLSSADVKRLSRPLFVKQGGLGDCDDPKQLKYKAAPLTGIWATAPYLHNGSVPTLADLLKPASARPKSFSMNVGLYDESNVGIDVNAKSRPVFDTSLWGNRNSGHEGVRYGTELSDSDKQDLLEYLKTL